MKKLLSTFAVATAIHFPILVSANKLEEVVVISSGIAMPIRMIGTAVTVIDRQELELKGYAPLAELLRSEVGIAATNTGGMGSATNLRIRGEDGFRSTVLIDGVDISDTTGTQIGPQIHHLMTSIDIERIEILRGPQGFRYGADAGGVIAIQTRQGQQDELGAVTAEYGRYNTAKLSSFISVGSDSGDFFISGTDIRTDGFSSRSDGDQAEEDGYENTTVHSKIGWNRDDLRAQFVLRNVNSSGEFDRCFSDAGYIDDCVNTFQQSMARASVDWEQENFSHEFSWNFSAIERASFSAGESGFAPQGEGESFEYLGSYSQDPRLTVVFGSELQSQSLDDPYNGESQREQWALLGEVQVEPRDDLFIAAGARYDDNEDFGEHTSIRVSAAQTFALSASSELKLRSSLGTGFRAPSLYEIAYNASNDQIVLPPLQEETTRGYDLGVDYLNDEDIHLELTYFDQSIDNDISFDLVNYSGYLQDGGKSVSRGWEVAFQVPVAQQWIFEGNYTRNNADTSTGERRSRRPKHTANASVTFNADDKITILIAVRALKDIVDNNVRLDNYTVHNASINFAVTPYLDLYSRVENAKDSEYQEVRNYNVAGAAAYFGFRYTF